MCREERHRGAFPNSRRLHGAVRYLAMLEALVLSNAYPVS